MIRLTDIKRRKVSFGVKVGKKQERIVEQLKLVVERYRIRNVIEIRIKRSKDFSNFFIDEKRMVTIIFDK